MGYELNLRLRDRSQPLDPVVDGLRGAALKGLFELPPAGADPAAEPTNAPTTAAPALEPVLPAAGDGPWLIPNGGRATVRAALYRSDDRPGGADLEVAFGGSEEEFRRFFAFAVRTAEAVSALVFDPQQGRTVQGQDVDRGVETWRQAQAWAVDGSGTYEDSRCLMEIEPPRPAVSPRARTLLALGGGLLALYLVIRAIARALTP